jgi:ABC-type transporter Mla maintaining outer membrane lipid asymmetry ATPase subunit MlaF
LPGDPHHGAGKPLWPQVVHQGLDLEVRRGEILGVVGGSGTGKSVLMRSIIGLQHYSAGRVEVLGRDIRKRHGVDSQPLGRAVSGRGAVFHADRGGKCRGAAQRISPRDGA